MARPVRMDYPDTFYHVLSRGNERRKIFREPQDYSRFIDTIRRMVDRFHVEIHAYVLMCNNYHLLIRTRHITEAVKRAEVYMALDKKARRRVARVLIDI